MAATLPKKRRRLPSTIPNAVTARATWFDWCEAVRLRTGSDTTECDRILQWWAANGVDPHGISGDGPFVLDGDAVKPRSMWNREMRKVDAKWRG